MVAERSQLRPSSEDNARRKLSRPVVESLNANKIRPSDSRTASKPESELGSGSGSGVDQFFPASVDRVRRIFRSEEQSRQSAIADSALRGTSAGWRAERPPNMRVFLQDKDSVEVSFNQRISGNLAKH